MVHVEEAKSIGVGFTAIEELEGGEVHNGMGIDSNDFV